ncbi:hypothetical protein [Muribaculum intestinale]|uniref:hypothetical protein n=1 Tax=Muribaculum intestinale TaxID=1796646 RepID=UPI0025A95693|nr:hypothetical protein [Muribaculum intestinale]
MNPKFRINDIVKLTDPQKQPYTLGHMMNLFRIIAINDDTVTLRSHSFMTFDTKLNDIQPVPINGTDDKNIYYDPVVMATFVLNPWDEVPAHHTDYSYYMEHFKRCSYKSKTFFDMVNERGIRYVHEVQRFLIDEFHRDELKS